MSEIIARYISPLMKEVEAHQKWDFRIYQHDRLPSDLLIILTCKTDCSDVKQRDFGVQIAGSLKDLGAVSHETWDQLSVGSA
jgi:hypothetical protein